MEFEVFKRKGGSWLGAARTWIKCNCIRGDSVLWGSDTKLMTTHGELTVKDVEEVSAKIGFAVLEKSLIKLEGYLKHLQGLLSQVDESKINLEINMGWEEYTLKTCYQRRIEDIESLIRQLKEDI